MYNEVAENILGTIGTILWCIQLVPQIIRNYFVKNCEGVPSIMMFLWALSGVPFSIYFIGTDGSIPLRVQPQLFTFCCIVTWAQTLYYPPNQWGVKKVTLFVGTFVLFAVGAEIGFTLWLRPIYRDGKEWPMLVFGIIATVLIGLGLIPPYFELAKRRGRVVGINFFFLGMDSLGALFSILSIVVGNMDIMSMVLYAVVIALELGIFTSHLIWYIRFGRKEKAIEKMQEGQEYEIPEAQELASQEEGRGGQECHEQECNEQKEREGDSQIEVRRRISNTDSLSQ